MSRWSGCRSFDDMLAVTRGRLHAGQRDDDSTRTALALSDQGFLLRRSQRGSYRDGQYRRGFVEGFVRRDRERIASVASEVGLLTFRRTFDPTADDARLGQQTDARGCLRLRYSGAAPSFDPSSASLPDGLTDPAARRDCALVVVAEPSIGAVRGRDVVETLLDVLMRCPYLPVAAPAAQNMNDFFLDAIHEDALADGAMHPVPDELQAMRALIARQRAGIRPVPPSRRDTLSRDIDLVVAPATDDTHDDYFM